MRFTPDEYDLICIYDTSSRNKVISDIQKAIPHIENAELAEIAESAVLKLLCMTNEEFAETEFVSQFGGANNG